MRLHTKILVGMVTGAAAGVAANAMHVEWLQALLLSLEPVGTAFIRLITMIVIPLVVASLLVGISSLGDLRSLGRIGGKTLAYFLITTIVAATIGLALALLVSPGARMDAGVRDELAAQFQAAVPGRAAVESTPSLVETLVQMVPRNPVAAAANLELLPLIIFVIVFGAAVGMVQEARRRALVTFFEGVNDACMVVIHWVMKLAPYAVFALIAAVVARFGLELLKSLLVYSGVVTAGLAVQAVVVFPLVLRFLGRVKAWSFYRRISEPMLLAFSTSSSNAALPLSIETAERKLGISKQITSFVVPLGATLNMNGSALYKAVTTVFIAQVYGVTLGLGSLLTVILTATLAAVAGVGVPGSSLVTTLIVLNAVGLGAHAEAGIALVLGVDRILDMMRTTINVTGDLVGAVFVARTEGEDLPVG
ncbi:MAG: dicarboxylate/amino acid:cation symporter [Gemmatimonadetes bacterium]|nr:dicarboxylate/amino acid:cation symporter [Gemmatimonadota bacterium]